MASEATITEELIFKAADELETKGEKVTIETVKALLATWTSTKGGSYATLSPAVRKWKGQQRTTSTEQIREPLPQFISDQLTGWAGQVWASALDNANARLATEREGLEKARVEMETETAEALALAEKLEGERDDARRALADLEQTHQVATLEADELRASLDAMTDRATTAEARAVELEARAGDLNRELERLHGELATERQARAQAETKTATLDAEKKAAEERAVATTNELEAERQRHQANQEQHQEERKRVAQETHRTAEKLVRLESERDEARKGEAQAREQAARQAGELEALRGVMARLAPDNKGKKPGTK